MWFIIALIVGVGLTALVFWLRSREIVVKWYEWLIGVVGLGLLLYTIQNFVTAFAELESEAAWMFLLVLGLPALILLVVAWLLPWRRQRAGS